MKTLTIQPLQSVLFLFFLFSCLISRADDALLNDPNCPAVSTLNISTGVDASGNLIPTTTVDPFWRLSNLPPTSTALPAGVGIPNAYAIVPFNNASNWNSIAGTPISQPISMRDIANFSANNLFSNQPWRFVREFCICETTEICLTGNMQADDTGVLTLYGAQGTGIALPVAATAAYGGNSPYPFNIDTPINFCTTLQPGTYYLEMELENLGSTAAGFVISANMTTTSGLATILSGNNDCCSAALLTIQKIFDADCNNEGSIGDAPGSNWVFDVYDVANGTTTQHTTDANGEIVLRGLDYGTYVITENLSNNAQPTVPGGHTQTVTLDPANPIQNIRFHNKFPYACTCIDSDVVPSTTQVPVEGCCWDLILDNNYGLFYDQVQVVANGFTFNSTFSSLGTILNNASNDVTLDVVIPMGTQNALTFCSSDLSGVGSVVVNWLYQGEVICENEIEVVCEEEEPPCVHFENVEVLCDSVNPNLFHLCLEIVNPATGTDEFDYVTWTTPGGVTMNPSNVSFSPALQPGQSSGTLCFDVFATGPFPQAIVLSGAAYGTNLLTGAAVCCHVDLPIELPRCCDPCETPWVSIDSADSEPGLCCYNLDIDNSCPDALSKIRVSTNNAGVNLVNLATIADWSVSPISSSVAEWTYTAGPYAPQQNFVDLAQFCIQNQSGAPNFSILVEYIYIGANGEETLCEQLFDLECDPGCLEVEYEVYCDQNGDFFMDFCVTVTSPTFIANGLDITKVSSIPGNLSLSQSTFSFPPLASPGVYCNTVQIFGIGSPAAASGDSMSLDFTLKNVQGNEIDCCEERENINFTLPECCCSSPDHFLNTIVPATTISTSGLDVTMANPLTTDCHQITIFWGDGSPNTFASGSQLNGGILHTYPSAGQWTVCYFIEEVNSAGELCNVHEDCATVELGNPECCQDEKYFLSTVVPATVITTSGNTITVDNPNVTDCHFIHINFGDGFSIDHVPASVLPYTYTYASAGSYEVCVDYEEGTSTEDICFYERVCFVVKLGKDNLYPHYELVSPEAVEMYADEVAFDTQMFPNPTPRTVRIATSAQQNIVVVQVFDLAGKMVFEQTSDAKSVEIDLGNLQAGMYLVRAIDANGNANTERIRKL